MKQHRETGGGINSSGEWEKNIQFCVLNILVKGK